MREEELLFDTVEEDHVINMSKVMKEHEDKWIREQLKRLRFEREFYFSTFRAKFDSKLKFLAKDRDRVEAENEHLTEMLRVAKDALKEISKYTHQAETVMEANAFYAAEDAIRRMYEMTEGSK
jgi:hypothetical protein